MKRREMICNRRPLAHGRPMEHHNITTAQLSSAPTEKIIFYFLVTRRISRQCTSDITHTAAVHHPPPFPFSPQPASHTYLLANPVRRTPQSASLRMQCSRAQRPAHHIASPPRYNPRARTSRARTHSIPGRATTGGGRSRGRCDAAVRVSASSSI